MMRLAREVVLALVWLHQLVGYSSPPRHRLRPGMARAVQRRRLGTATVAAPRGLSPYPAFVAVQGRVQREAWLALR
jgi:hypothetical protein